MKILTCILGVHLLLGLDQDGRGPVEPVGRRRRRLPDQLPHRQELSGPGSGLNWTRSYKENFSVNFCYAENQALLFCYCLIVVS